MWIFLWMVCGQIVDKISLDFHLWITEIFPTELPAVIHIVIPCDFPCSPWLFRAFPQIHSPYYYDY